MRYLVWATAVLLAGCASGPPESEKPPADRPAEKPEAPAAQPPQAKEPAPAPAPEAKPEAPAARPEAPAVQAPAAPQGKYDKILDEFLSSQKVRGQEQVLESQKWYDIAVTFRAQNEYEKAKVAVEKAIEIWPLNAQARRLKDEIDGALNQPGRPDQGQNVVNQQLAITKGQIIETMNHIRAGERYLAAREYEKSLREFQEAEIRILAMPAEIPERGTFLPVVRDYQQRIKRAMEEEEKVRMDKEKKAEEETQRLYAETEKREIVRKIHQMLEMAYMAFDQRKYESVISLCEKILWIDSTYTVAQELMEDAKKVTLKHEYRENVKRKIIGWKQLALQDEEARIPWQKYLVFPSRLQWQEIEKRAAQSVLKSIEDVEEPEVIAEVKNKLNSMKIDLAYSDEPFENVLSYLREYTGLNFIIDKDAGADTQKPITFKVKGVTVATALRYLLSSFDLAYTITEEKFVLITKPENARGKPVLDLYDIRDLSVKLSSFPGPRLELLSPTGAGGAPGGAAAGVTFSLEEPEAPKVSPDDIVTLITDNIQPKVWEQSDKYHIQMTPNQQLLVSAPTEVHREIRDFLQRIRSYQGIMVNVEVRFLATYHDAMEEIQVDLPATTTTQPLFLPPTPNNPLAPNFLPGSNPSTPPGGLPVTTTTDLHDFTQVSGSNIMNPWQWVPGFFESASIGGQVFHTLLQADPVFAAAGLPIVNDPMSGRIRNQGGLGLSYTWIGDQTFTAFLRAVAKDQKATIVNAPKITAFNGQRSHIISVTRLAYIKDVDVQALGFGASYQPVIGYLNHGVVLDVKPIVSNDRRYVTLEIRCDFAELITMRFLDLETTANQNPGTPSPGGAQTAVPVARLAVQMPYIVYQRVNTAALVPDRGTLVLGGFRDLTYVDAFSGLPFYDNIPILDFFFSKRGKRNERRRLFVLVTPEIIDVVERERQQF